MKLKREQPLRQPKLRQKDTQNRKSALRKRKTQDAIQNATAEITVVTAAERMTRGMTVARNPLRHL
jgi:ribosomal protein S25